jgi:serine/threonine protein kinase
MNKYKIIDKICDGRFGSVYKGEHIITKEVVAIKSSIINEYNNLKYEAKIYQYINRLNIKGFPKLKWYGCDNKMNYIVLKYYPKSLRDFINEKHNEVKQFDTSIEIIEVTKNLHKLNLIHRDIKPDNFVFDELMSLHMIDFGFCKKIIYENKNDISIEKKKNIIGSPKYISLNIHEGISPSRRDDIESCIYIIIEMLLGELVWNKYNELDLIYVLKKKYRVSNYKYLFLNIILDYIRKLGYKEEPDYDMIKNILLYEKANYM